MCVYLQVSPLQVQKLGAADVVADEGVFVLPQAELLQPGGHLLSTPPLNYTIKSEKPPSVSNPRTLAGHKQTGSGRKEEQIIKNHTGKRNQNEMTQR